MLHLLLDEHISPNVAITMRKLEPKVKVEALTEWQQGQYIGLPDDVILAAAHRDGRTLVTYDQVTIVPLLSQLAEQESHHGGVVFVSHWTIRQNDFGKLARILVALWQAEHKRNWIDRCVYAQP